MTAADYLASFVAAAADHLPSITICTLQRNNRPPGTPNWSPGIASYSWGINGKIVEDATGAMNSLSFEIYSWFSDRRTNTNAVNAPDWQQFSASAKDLSRLVFSPRGTEVHLEFQLITWGSHWAADSMMFDDPSQQLLFAAPGAGPNAAPALMIVNFHPTGQLAFL